MTQNIRIGVFIPNGAQALDTAAVDVLGSMSTAFTSTLPPGMGIDQVPDVTLSYITTPKQGNDIPLTSGMTLRATHTIGDQEAAPGKFDMVVVPGPDHWDDLDQDGLAWLREQAKAPGVDILSICTGIFVSCEAGIFNGKNATGPRGLQEMLKSKYPDVNFQGDKYRYVQDGNFWSSGSVTNGNDMLAAYARTGKHWPQHIVEMILNLMDTGDRGNVFPDVKE